jgi:hypothetical protein
MMTHQQVAKAAEQMDEIIADQLAKELQWIMGEGALPTEVERYMEMRREVWATWRCTTLTQYNEWLQHGCETTH